jgi:hypothetical protein
LPVRRDVVGAPRGDLRKLGILDLGVAGVGPQTPPDPGPNGVARQEVTFAVSYEFLKFPEAASGVIKEVPLDLDLSGDRDPRKLISAEFSAQSLAWFDVVDDPLATSNAPSSWSFDAVEQMLGYTLDAYDGYKVEGNVVTV